MKGWRQVLAIWAGALTLGYVIPRFIWLRRGKLPVEIQKLKRAEGENLAIAHIRREHRHLVVVVHGLLKRMDNAQIAAFVRALEPHYDVLVLDLPGHGMSEGKTDLSYTSAAKALGEALDYATTLGYAHVGVVGYSMGAAAAILALANGARADALASISCPTRAIVETRIGPLLSRWPLRAWLGLMGTRVAAPVAAEPGPLACIAQVAPVPVLVVHDELDTLVCRQESEILFAAARPPKDWLHVPGAPHAWPMASARQVIAWLQQRMPDGAEE